MFRTAIAFAIATALLGAGAAQARTYEVTARTDHKPDGCSATECTLREAVIAANKHRGADTIALPSRKRYELALASTGEDRAANGDLDITSGPLTIVHRGRGTATIDAKAHRFERRDIFVVPSWQTLSLAADEDTLLFSFSDRPVQQALGLWREQHLE